jgi:hypothetical protein
MQQNCLFVGYNLTEKFCFLHFLYYSAIVYIKIWPVGELKLFVLFELIELVVTNTGVAYCYTTLAFPAILSFNTTFAFDMFDSLSVEAQSEEIVH